MRRMITIGLVALAGCSPQPEPAANATANVAVIGGIVPAGPPPPLGTIDLGQPLRAFGTEPGWMLDVTPGVITYTDYSTEDPKAETFAPAIPAVAGGKAVWRTRNTKGEPVVLTLTLKDCLEAGEEDMTVPLTAEFKMGSTTRTGCAGLKPEGEAGVEAENTDDE